MKLKFYSIFMFLFFSLNSTEHMLSFIVPCYNCATTVEESIESIYHQNLKIPFEVICTNDGSTDNTLTILKNCQIKYPNLFVYTHEHNKGGGATRNTCVTHSHGDLIFCLDSDNVLCPNSVGKLIDLLDESGCDVASFAEGKAFKENFLYVQTFSYSVPGNTYDLYAWAENPFTNPAYGGNYLYTRKSYDRAGKYIEDVGAVDTFAFGLAQLATGSIMKTLPGTFYWHRLHDDSYCCREIKKIAPSINYCKACNYFSEIFSIQGQKILHGNPEEMWSLFGQKKLELASPEILQCLFKAHEYKYQKQYAKAAEEFSNAIKHGCKSSKIDRYINEMWELTK